jgi:hypothetical protein
MRKYLVIYEEAVSHIWLWKPLPSGFSYIWGIFLSFLSVCCVQRDETGIRCQKYTVTIQPYSISPPSHPLIHQQSQIAIFWESFSDDYPSFESLSPARCVLSLCSVLFEFPQWWYNSHRFIIYIPGGFRGDFPPLYSSENNNVFADIEPLDLHTDSLPHSYI